MLRSASSGSGTCVRVNDSNVLVVPPFECAWLTGDALSLQGGSGCVCFEVKGRHRGARAALDRGQSARQCLETACYRALLAMLAARRAASLQCRCLRSPAQEYCRVLHHKSCFMR